MADDPTALTRELYAAFNRGDLAAVLARLDPDVEVIDPDRTGRTHHGPEGYRAFLEEWLESWESYRVEITGMTRNGERVLVDVTQHGVGKGSGVEFSEPFFQTITFRGDRVTRFEVYLDRADAERAAGLRN